MSIDSLQKEAFFDKRISNQRWASIEIMPSLDRHQMWRIMMVWIISINHQSSPSTFVTATAAAAAAHDDDND